MTLPNEADGLSPNAALAFPLTAESVDAQQSLATRDTFDQPTVEDLLKAQMQGSAAWQYATGVGFAGLPANTPLVIGILAKIAEQFTGIPASTWVTMWLGDPSVPNLGTVIQDSLAAIYQTSVNMQQFLGSLDFTDPDFDLVAAANTFFDIILAPIGKIAQLVGGFILSAIIPGLDASKITSGTFANPFVPGLVALINALFGSGTIGAFILNAIIPGFDASQIISGLFSQSQVSGLPADLAAKVTTTTSALYVPNNNFPSDLSWWHPYATASGPATPTYDGTQGHTTLGSAKLIGNGTVYVVVANPLGGEWPVLPGQTYTLSAWVKWSSLTNGIDTEMGIFPQDGAHQYFSTGQAYTPIGAAGSGGWSNFTVNFTAPANAIEFGIEFINRNTGTIWIDEVAITQTNVLAQAQTPSIEGQIQRTIEDITSAIDNFFHPGSSSHDMQQSLAAQTATIAAQAAELAKLKAENEAANYSGYWDFDPYDYSGNLSGIAWYTSSFLVNSASEGQLVADGINAGGVRASTSAGNWEQMLTTNNQWFAGAGTLTDYQKVSTPLANAFNYFNDGFGDTREIRFHHYLRCNAAQTQWVRWEIRAVPVLGSLRVRLQYKNGGAITNLGSEQSIGNIGSGVTIESYAGVVGADRTFQIKADNDLLHSVNDGSSVTAMGSSNRHAGWGEGYSANNIFILQKAFPFIQHLVISDNTPASVIGSIAQYTRTGTGQVSSSSGQNLFPTSFFDTTTRVSPDVTPDLTNGKFTISKTGTYNIKASVKAGNSFPNRISLLLYIGGNPSRTSGVDSARTTNGIGAAQLPRYIEGKWTVYLTAPTDVQLGYDSDGASINTFTGEATGLQTYFTIGVSNWSLK